MNCYAIRGICFSLLTFYTAWSFADQAPATVAGGPTLKAVVLAPATEDTTGISATPRTICGEPPGEATPDTVPPVVLSNEQLAEIVAPYLGKPIDETLTTALIGAVVARIEEDSHYLADVYFPPEANRDIRNGTLALVIRPARLGKVVSQGQQHHAANDIECRIRLRSAQPLDLRQLSTDIARLNASSSWRYTDPTPRFVPGEQRGTTDIVLDTVDEAPWRVYVSADNTGTRTTDQGRIREGIIVGNFLGNFDHQLGYSHISSPIHRHYHGDILDYTMPLDGGDRLGAHIEYTKTDVGLQHGLFQNTGKNLISYLERTHLLSSGGSKTPTNHEIYAGIDYKRIGSTLAFGQEQISDVTPQVMQGYVGWRASWKDGLGSNLLQTRLTVSPGKLVDNNDNHTFDESRPGAKAHYWRFNIDFDRNFALPDTFLSGWQVNTRMNAQLGSNYLLASERFGLSGVGGVRGYYQDTLIADRGLVGSIELLTPQHPTTIALQPSTWQLLGFIDAGRSWNADKEYNDDLKRTGKSFTLASVGIGTRVNVGKNAVARFDFAHPLKDRSRELPVWFVHGYFQLAF